MHRLVLTALATSALGMRPALADPLPLSSASTRHRLVTPVVQTVQTETSARGGETRYAAAGTSNLGGGLIQALFGGGPRTLDTPQYQAAAPAYGRYQEQSDSNQRSVDPRYLPQFVAYDGSEAAGTIIVDTRQRFLYLVQAEGRAMRYGIGVGRPGFTWAGVKTISAKREWPDWRPPTEMLKRRPDLPSFMAGGPQNPLGARAMYLGSTLYRIHGSKEP